MRWVDVAVRALCIRESVGVGFNTGEPRKGGGQDTHTHTHTHTRKVAVRRKKQRGKWGRKSSRAKKLEIAWAGTKTEKVAILKKEHCTRLRIRLFPGHKNKESRKQAWDAKELIGLWLRPKLCGGGLSFRVDLDAQMEQITSKRLDSCFWVHDHYWNYGK